MIMTVFLWHSTVMMLVVGLAFWQAPSVLAQFPDTSGWWLTRPIWIFVYSLVTLPFSAGVFEVRTTDRESCA